MKQAKLLFVLFFCLSSLNSKAQFLDLSEYNILYKQGKYQDAWIAIMMQTAITQEEQKLKSISLARVNYNLGQYKQCLDELTKLQDPRYDALLAMTYFKLDSFHQLIHLINNDEHLESYNDTIYLVLADAQFKIGRFEEAIIKYRMIQVLDKNYSYTIFKKLGIAEYYFGMYFNAMENLQKALAVLPSDYEIYSYLGMSYFNVHNIDKAIRTLRQGIDPKDPLSAECAVNLGLVYDEILEYDSSLWVLEDALEIDSNRLDAYYFLGNIHYNRKQYEKSNFYYTKLLSLNPKFEYAYEPLANSLFFSGLYDEAINKYRQSTYFNGNDPKSFNLIGICYLQKKDYITAFHYFEEAAKVSPDYGLAYFNLASLAFDQAWYDEAISYCSYALKSNPEDGDIHFLLGRTYIQLGMLDQAQSSLESCIKYNSLNANAYRYLGDICLMKNEKRKASFYYGFHTILDPSSFDGFYYLGLNQFNLSDFNESKKSLSKALEIQNDSYSCKIALAKTLIKLGENAQALVLLEEAYQVESSAKLCLILSIAHKNLKNKNEARYFEELAYEIDPVLKNYIF
ncbi:MAG: tetratricopeptide repeat protein [Chitinophagales bacterium]|nr:tetratricopeptide repeat protein [Chitinophagales bacterium]